MHRCCKCLHLYEDMMHTRQRFSVVAQFPVVASSRRFSHSQVATSHTAALPRLLAVTALRVLSPITTPDPSQSAPSFAHAAQATAVAHSLLALLRLVLPLLSSTESAALLPEGPATSRPASRAARSRAVSPSRAGSRGVRRAVSSSRLNDRPSARPATPTPPPPAKASSRNADSAQELQSGPLTALLLLPLQGPAGAEHHKKLGCAVLPESRPDLARQAADLLVAACGADDPRDEILDRLMPFWLQVFACTAEQRRAYGIVAAASAASGAEDGHLSHVADSSAGLAGGSSADGAFWGVVKTLYSHVVATLGASTARALVINWRELESGLAEHMGWRAESEAASPQSSGQLLLRQSLQVSALQQRGGSPVSQPDISSTARLLDGTGWSAPPARAAKARAGGSKHGWARWVPQTATDPASGPPPADPHLPAVARRPAAPRGRAPATAAAAVAARRAAGAAARVACASRARDRSRAFAVPRRAAHRSCAVQGPSRDASRTIVAAARLFCWSAIYRALRCGVLARRGFERRRHRGVCRRSGRAAHLVACRRPPDPALWRQGACSVTRCCRCARHIEQQWQRIHQRRRDSLAWSLPHRCQHGRWLPGGMGCRSGALRAVHSGVLHILC
jgi:hypothetical protein